MKGNLLSIINAYEPDDEQEAADKEIMAAFIRENDNCLLRDNRIAHFSASAWVVNEDRTKVLMIYHNIYKSWAWTGGHADGEEDLLKVAVKEAEEESGLRNIQPISREPMSLETLCVNSHWKKGIFVPAHLHFNVTYLLQADEKEPLKIKEDENSGVRWIEIQKAPVISTEECMQEIYRKLNNKMEKY